MQSNSILTKMRAQQFESWGEKMGKGEKSEICVQKN